MDRNWTFPKKKVGLALNVNRKSGTPMLESTCECGFVGELEDDQILYDVGVAMPASPKDPACRSKYRVDFLLNGKMIVELKGCLPGDCVGQD